MQYNNIDILPLPGIEDLARDCSVTVKNVLICWSGAGKIKQSGGNVMYLSLLSVPPPREPPERKYQ